MEIRNLKGFAWILQGKNDYSKLKSILEVKIHSKWIFENYRYNSH